MCTITHARLFKALKWVFHGILLILSGWFMSDVWTKFQAKDKCFITYEIERTHEPTTVICFDPYVKPTILRKYNTNIMNFLRV